LGGLKIQLVGYAGARKIEKANNRLSAAPTALGSSRHQFPSPSGLG
jgi:hypothetical protein